MPYSATLTLLPGHPERDHGGALTLDPIVPACDRLHLRLMATHSTGMVEMRTFMLGSNRITSLRGSGAVVVKIGSDTIEIRPPDHAASVLWLSAMLSHATGPPITAHGWFYLIRAFRNDLAVRTHTTMLRRRKHGRRRVQGLESTLIERLAFRSRAAEPPAQLRNAIREQFKRRCLTLHHHDRRIIGCKKAAVKRSTL